MNETHPRGRPRSRRPFRASSSPVALATLPTALLMALLVVGWSPSPDPVDPDITLDLPPELLPAGLPLEMNEPVERWVRRFLRDPDSFQSLLDRKARYAPMVREKLLERGMPEELLYLALIESGFSNRATSEVQAAGVWQMMPPTAMAFGLRVDGWVDERRDPVLSTGAALDYLELLHEKFGSWYLAAAAYNCGPARVARALRGREGTPSEAVIWEILPQLPPETRQFIPKLVAASTLARDPERFGLRHPSGAEVTYDQVFVPGGTSLHAVSRVVGVPTARLLELNPHLLRGVTPPGVSYPVRVPPGESSRVVASLAPVKRASR
jgi:membrane-bound lytic murein transglycosylase D